MALALQACLSVLAEVERVSNLRKESTLKPLLASAVSDPRAFIIY